MSCHIRNYCCGTDGLSLSGLHDQRDKRIRHLLRRSLHTHSAIYAKNTYLVGEGGVVEESKKMLLGKSVLQCSVQMYALQGAADRQNEITETRSTHRSVTISEISAEVVILLKVSCENIIYRKKKYLCLDNKYKGNKVPHFVRHSFVSGCLFWKGCVYGIHKCDFQERS